MLDRLTLARAEVLWGIEHMFVRLYTIVCTGRGCGGKIFKTEPDLPSPPANLLGARGEMRSSERA